ncbi:MAG: hypothetical protein WEE20_03720 [Bacteroidota bacterium]
MKQNPFIIAAMLLALMAGCKEQTTGPEEILDETDGRITITNDETVLNDRVTITDEDIAVEEAGLGKGTRTMAFSLKLIAEIKSPRVSGQTLQATSIALVDGYAYVSFMMIGVTAIGGVDAVELKKGSNPKLKSQATFADTDVISVSYHNDNVYLSGATGNPAFDVPAVVEVIDAPGGKFKLKNSFRRQLKSYAATSIAAGSSGIYTTTGNTGGLFVLVGDTLTIQSEAPLDDARWVGYDDTYLVVVQGTPGRITVYNKASLAHLSTYNFDGASIAESKSTVQIIGGKALIAAGDGGVVLMNLLTGAVVGSIPRTIVAGLDPSVTVTNAVAASGKYVFISNGEAGVYVAESSHDLGQNTGGIPITLKVLGKLKFKNLQSVNHVAFDGSDLVIASGLGGVKIVRMTL